MYDRGAVPVRAVIRSLNSNFRAESGPTMKRRQHHILIQPPDCGSELGKAEKCFSVRRKDGVLIHSLTVLCRRYEGFEAFIRVEK